VKLGKLSVKFPFHEYCLDEIWVDSNGVITRIDSETGSEVIKEAEGLRQSDITVSSDDAFLQVRDSQKNYSQRYLIKSAGTLYMHELKDVVQKLEWASSSHAAGNKSLGAVSLRLFFVTRK